MVAVTNQTLVHLLYFFFCLISPISYSKEAPKDFLTKIKLPGVVLMSLLNLTDLTDFCVCHSLPNDYNHYLINILFNMSNNSIKSSKRQPQFLYLPLKVPFSTSICFPYSILIIVIPSFFWVSKSHVASGVDKQDRLVSLLSDSPSKIKINK